MSARYHQNQQTAGRVIEGQAYIVTPNNQKLHTLNQTATVLWQLAAGGCTADEAADTLVARFQVEREQALADATRCLEDLVVRQILVAR
jgi:hypothetical protein